MQFECSNITLDEDGVYIDGHRIPALTIAPNVVVHHGGGNEAGPKVTLTVYANEVTITDEAKANEGCTITEVRGDKQVCTQTYTKAGCSCCGHGATVRVVATLPDWATDAFRQ